MNRRTNLIKALAMSMLVATAGVASADTIKIGINQPLTGPFAASGTYIVDGAKIAAADRKSVV